MNKKKIVILTLLMVAVLVLTSSLFVACNKNTDPTPEAKATATEGLLITNSDFNVVGVDKTSYPRTVDNWTGSKMYSTSVFREDVTAGAISLDKALYDANKSNWGDSDSELYNKLNKDGRFDNRKNKNVLMVYMPEKSTNDNGTDIHGPTAFGYTSSSFTLDKGSYYKLSVDVLTHDIKGITTDDNPDIASGKEAGARIYLSSNTYAEHCAIQSEDVWTTYEIYIETSPTSTTSLTVQLGLGKYTSSYSNGLTTGYAFFDNLTIKKLVTEDVPEDEVLSKEKVVPTNDYATPSELYKFEADEELKTPAGQKSTVTVSTLKVPNGGFEFGSSTVSSSTAPNSWSTVTGNSSGEDPAPRNLARSAVIDVTKFADDYATYSASYNLLMGTGVNSVAPAAQSLAGYISSIQDFSSNRIGNNVFMLSQSLMGANGIRSSKSITIEKGKIYELSIDIYTADIHGNGVSLILKGSDGKDIKIEGISRQKDDNVYIGKNVIDVSREDCAAGEPVDGASTNGWTRYYFYIKGNDFSDYSYNMEVWLGTDGTNSNNSVTYRNYTRTNTDSYTTLTTYRANGTFSNGWVFMDDLRLNEIDNDKWESIKDDAQFSGPTTNNDKVASIVGSDDKKGIIVDLSNNANLFEKNGYILENVTPTPTLDGVSVEGKGVPAGWKSNYDVNDKSNPAIVGNITEGVVDLKEEGSFPAVFGDYPGMPYANMANAFAYAIHSNSESYYEVESSSIPTIEANKFYRISFWLKTVNVSKTSGAYVYVLNKTAQEENKAKDNNDDEVQLTSYTRINTDGADEYYNDWVEVKLVVRGATDKKTKIALKFTLGYGNKWAASTLTSGAMYVTNFNMTEITYANYNGTSTGTYTKSVNLSDSYTYTFTNGNFDNFDLDDPNFKGGLLQDQGFAIKPANWTINDEKLNVNQSQKETVPGEEEPVYNRFAGIFALNKVGDTSGDTSGQLNKYNGSSQTNNVTGLDSTFFEDFYQTADGFDENTLKRSAGPNILGIGVKKDSSDEFAAGFASSSFTLSANTFYVLSVYARVSDADAFGSVFLTGEASTAADQSNYFDVTNANADKLAKFTFYIRVGKTSVSLKLNLWLGKDKQYFKDGNEDDLKSGGAVFFDNVYLGTIDEKEYNNAEKDLSENSASAAEEDATSKLDKNTNKVLSFLTDSFDPLSSTIESRESLTSPNGWTGAPDTDQSSSNTLSGVVYADNVFYGDKGIDDGDDNDENSSDDVIEIKPNNNTYKDRDYEERYVKILGKNYTTSDVTVTDEERERAKNDPEYEYYAPEYQNIDDARIVESIKARKLKDMKYDNWLPMSQLNNNDFGAHSGNSLLVINNTALSAYTYTSSTNTFTHNSYYKVSVWVRTYGVKGEDGDDKAGAYIELYLGSANDSDNPLRFEAINHEAKKAENNADAGDDAQTGDDEGWQQYTFFVQTHENDVTSVTLKLSLGKYFSEEIDGETKVTGLTSGYAFFDDVLIEKSDAQAYADAVQAVENGEKNILTREVADETSGSPDDDEDDGTTQTPSRQFNLTNLWWMIPTIVLGLIIIVTVIVVIVRKLYKPGKRGAAPTKAKKTTTPQATEMLDEKNRRYDDDNE